jgi:hypothetical protein
MSRDRLSRRVVLAGGGLAMVLGGLSLFRDGPRDVPHLVRRRAEDVARRHGVRIVLHGLPADDASGRAASLPEIPDGIVTVVDPAVLPWALDGIERALGAYPEGFYGRHCATIFVCGSLTFEGRPAGGAYVPGQDWIVLAAPSDRGQATIETTSELGIHHEFSSIVWARAVTLPGRWATLLPPGQAFAESTGRALDVADAPPPPLETGFLSAYSATSAENDFNTYAETVFTQPARLLALSNQHRTVAAKLALVLASYVDLEPRMEAVFRRLGFGALIGASRELVPSSAGVSPLKIPAGQLVEQE